MTRIVVLSDTHARNIDELHSVLLAEIKAADLVVHCGDFTDKAVLDGLRKAARRFIGVYGNVDPPGVRSELPSRHMFELEGMKIAVAHPHWGGPPFGIERRLREEFPQADVILFGHTHERQSQRLGKVLLLNPGQAYSSWRVPASIGVLTITQGKIESEIRVLGVD